MTEQGFAPFFEPDVIMNQHISSTVDPKRKYTSRFPMTQMLYHQGKAFEYEIPIHMKDAGVKNGPSNNRWTDRTVTLGGILRVVVVGGEEFVLTSNLYAIALEETWMEVSREQNEGLLARNYPMPGNMVGQYVEEYAGGRRVIHAFVRYNRNPYKTIEQRIKYWTSDPEIGPVQLVIEGDRVVDAFTHLTIKEKSIRYHLRPGTYTESGRWAHPRYHYFWLSSTREQPSDALFDYMSKGNNEKIMI